MNFELSQRFFFEATHTLARKVEADGSRRFHGHTYHAEVTVRGTRDPATGMVSDLAVLRAQIEAVRGELDHRLLDDVPGLGAPTLENLSSFIADRLRGVEPPVVAVRVWREATGDSCLLRLPARDR
ncbi:MAG TPA: 6-carboxytetrahydropterin synthase [Burkholderiales bacterium]|jgi:6-pyruvoyltetrahydropterin/6-carboxytetrahydropterin synthase|nr:6-carboxytetrahydropterin synthase [Burkholderiales bacterium]